MTRGRPSSFTQEIADKICERLANGESLRTICLDVDMPSRDAVYRWLATLPNFQGQYAHAKELQADAIFDEILDIADEASNDWMLKNDNGNESYSLNGEHVQRSRLRIDARKWMAGKLRPKVYGDKTSIEHGGAIKVENAIDLSKLDEGELNALAAIAAKSQSDTD